MNVGSRGGSGLSRAAAEHLMEQFHADEMGWLRARILMLALKYDGYHGDQLEAVKLRQRNAIGAVTGALVRQGLLYQTNEHRASKAAASHGRRSYVYRLTGAGEKLAEHYREELVDLGQQVPVAQREPDTLFDPDPGHEGGGER